jgi:hypothetical protein
LRRRRLEADPRRLAGQGQGGRALDGRQGRRRFLLVRALRAAAILFVYLLARK